MKNDSEIVTVEPGRNESGQLVFHGWPEFRPNLTPKQVLELGSFGGTYFRPIYSSVTRKRYGAEVWQELPPTWLEGLDIERQVASPIYNSAVNKYGVKCGASLEQWEGSGWINSQVLLLLLLHSCI